MRNCTAYQGYKHLLCKAECFEISSWASSYTQKNTAALYSLMRVERPHLPTVMSTRGCPASVPVMAV